MAVIYLVLVILLQSKVLCQFYVKGLTEIKAGCLRMLRRFFFFLLLTFRYLSTFAEQLRNPLEVLTILGEEKKENGRREDGTRSLDNK